MVEGVGESFIRSIGCIQGEQHSRRAGACAMPGPATPGKYTSSGTYETRKGCQQRRHMMMNRIPHDFVIYRMVSRDRLSVAPKEWIRGGMGEWGNGCIGFIRVGTVNAP